MQAIVIDFTSLDQSLTRGQGYTILQYVEALMSKRVESRCAVIKPFQVSNCNMTSTVICTATFVTQD